MPTTRGVIFCMTSYRIRGLAFAFGAALLAAPAFAAEPGHPVTTADINAADIGTRDKAISDDYFEGRGPGTKAGQAASQWIADEMKRIGLKPGNKGSYFQEVPAVNITLDAPNLRWCSKHPRARSTEIPDEDVCWTPQFKSADVTVKDSDLVFVGYGIVAPEYKWNDYAGVDVKERRLSF